MAHPIFPDEPRDADRLFARPIIEYISAFRSLNASGALEPLRQDVELRRKLARDLAKEAAECDRTTDEVSARTLMLKAISELEAFDAIQRARKAVHRA